MAKQKRIAITAPAGPSLRDTRRLIEWAAAADGVDGAWFADSSAPDALTTMAAMGPYAGDLRMGIAVVPVYTRTPAVLAATANALGQVYPGRFILGLGSSSQAIMERFNGIPLEKPLTRVKETAIMVRSMLAGEKSDFDLSTLTSKGYRQLPLEEPVPLYMAALRPKMIEMAAEVGDGVIFNLWPSRALPKMMEHAAAGAARAGKSLDDIEIVNRSMVLVTDDIEWGRQRFREQFGPYYANPVYNEFLKWGGFPEEAQGILDGWAARDREKTAMSLTDEAVDEIAIIGPPDVVRERVREQAEAGIDTTIVLPIGFPSPALDEQLTTYEAFADFRF